MKISAKSCPNCGANLKFKLNDEFTTCQYCRSKIKIKERKKQYDRDYKYEIYINKKWEVFKWIMSILHLPFTLLIAYLLITRSNPIFSILIVLGGVLSIPALANLVFKNNRIIKVITIELLIVVGFIGSVVTIYPFNIDGKLYSKNSDMVIEIKGNYITIEQNGKKTKEKLNYKLGTEANNRKYYTITTSKYKFLYIQTNGNGLGDQFYLMDDYEEVDYFYTKKQLEVFGEDLHGLYEY